MLVDIGEVGLWGWNDVDAVMEVKFNCIQAAISNSYDLSTVLTAR